MENPQNYPGWKPIDECLTEFFDKLLKTATPQVAQFEYVTEFINEQGNNMVELYKNFPLPRRATSGSAGYDFFCYAEQLCINPEETMKIDTHIKCNIQPGWVLKLYPRSSYGIKHGTILANTVGIIDSDYYNNPSNEGRIIVALTNHGDHPLYIDKGDAFCQGIFEKYGITVDDIPVREARIGGIGSTGK